jgi:hypothetical protein
MFYAAQGKVKKLIIQKNKKQSAFKKGVNRDRAAYLDRLIDEAVVDSYNESEQITGLFTMLEENLKLPFTTTVLGVEVIVERVDMNASDEIVAICRRGRERQRIPILDLPLPEPKPQGAEWIEAFRRWAGGR